MKLKNNENGSLLESMLNNNSIVSILVVVLGFLVGTILVALVGKNPANMYKAVIQALTGYNFNQHKFYIRYIGETLNYMVPFVLCGFSMAFAARSGLFNIGGEGQYIVGMTVAQILALFFPQVPVLHPIVCILGAVLAGAIWGGVVGLLKAKFEVSEVVSTIMLNYIALYLSRIICLAIPGSNTYKTPNFPKTALISNSFFMKITQNSLLNNGIFLMIAAVIIYWYVMEKTTLGFSLRATGYNKDAAKMSGINVVRSITVSMAVSGAFAALAGAIVALGSFKYGRVISGMDNYGFNGIAVALVGNNTALGTLFAGFLFGLLKNAQPLMQGLGIPKEITFIIQGLIVVFIALRAGLQLYVQYLQKKRLQKEVLSKNE
jgi:ABC-type uncharacterized transport system, permease component